MSLAAARPAFPTAAGCKWMRWPTRLDASVTALRVQAPGATPVSSPYPAVARARVVREGRRQTKRTIVIATLCAVIIVALQQVIAPESWYCYDLVFTYYLGSGIFDPGNLGIFSASAGENEQGRVMRVSIAVFTLASGITSLLGGDLMSVDIGSPFYISCGAAVLGIFLLMVIWRQREIVLVTS